MYEIKENSIELWAIETEKLFRKDQQPMNDELSQAFVTCCLNEEEMEKDVAMKEALEKNKLAYSSVFYNRVRCCHTFEASIALCVFMGMASNSFGEVTIYANYLQYQAHKHNQKRLDIKFVSTYVFPMGFPSKGTLQKVWDMQKVERKDVGDSDNLLDHACCQKSISFYANHSA